MIQSERKAFSIISNFLTIPYHLICGFHSNIKYCCVLYWVFYYNWADINGLREEFTYIPCPRCVKLKPREIKRCHCYEESSLYKYTLSFRDYIAKFLRL